MEYEIEQARIRAELELMEQKAASLGGDSTPIVLSGPPSPKKATMA